MSAEPLYRRVLLKLSGEALMGGHGHGWHLPTVRAIVEDIATVCRLGIQIGIVIGGGNIIRGASSLGSQFDRGDADHMGMLATVINSLVLKNSLEAAGIASRSVSAIPMPTVCEPFVRPIARRHLEDGFVVVFGGGTGNPFFTTDTAAALRAVEMGCDVLCKGTQVDGIYTSDPKKNADAKRYTELSFDEVLAKDLKVMDAAAIALARDNSLPVIVFSISEPGSFAKVMCGEGTCSIVH